MQLHCQSTYNNYVGGSTDRLYSLHDAYRQCVSVRSCAWTHLMNFLMFLETYLCTVELNSIWTTKITERSTHYERKGKGSALFASVQATAQTEWLTRDNSGGEQAFLIYCPEWNISTTTEWIHMKFGTSYLDSRGWILITRLTFWLFL